MNASLRKERSTKVADADPLRHRQPLTLRDFRRTAISGMQIAGVSAKEASVMVGATPEVIRRHYEKMDQVAIARRNVERRLGADGTAQPLRARCARVARTALLTWPRVALKLLKRNP
jgi:hypothetical protein